MGKVLRVLVVLVVIWAVVYVSGVWPRIETRMQPWLLDGPSGRWIARTYPMFAGWLYAAFARVLDLQPQDEVLDVACGSGVFLKRHADHVSRIAGLDQSKAMIDEAIRQNQARVDAGTAEFVVADVTELPWPDRSFTVVTSNDVGCYEAKAQRAIEEMFRVLRPGGRAVLADDRRELMTTAGFTRLSVEPILRLGHVTVGYKP
jgi:SAM-dependent methyltransferase